MPARSAAAARAPSLVRQRSSSLAWPIEQRDLYSSGSLHWPRQQWRLFSSSGDASSSQPAGAGASVPRPPPVRPDVADLDAKLALLEQHTGATAEQSLRRGYGVYLCGAAHHIAVRLAFLDARGKLRRPPRLWEVICPSDVELCAMHELQLDDLAAFKAAHLASPQWAAFCEQHAVTQAQPAAAT
ncbi:central region isoform B [Micractinium conductrix]|uniref:Central region isoform B n=1 Tax=Micractinium conductrix TaxID=554055 RepID=A0A2P6V130_9CHLO|nr:central region isoform B [Micractinium conductrix]|eukprot:PSC67796.1 central region isoform B [Micractinium conductrix]